MARSRRLLSGAVKDAFLARLLADEPGLDEATKKRIVGRLQQAVVLLGARDRPHRALKARSLPGSAPPLEAGPTPAAPSRAPPTPGPAPDTAPPAPTAAEPHAKSEPFDPFSPNVIVVFRTRGRDAALAELEPIEDIASLRLLAREQQLGIASDLADPSAIRQAIVAAAERRIANRRAAAS